MNYTKKLISAFLLSVYFGVYGAQMSTISSQLKNSHSQSFSNQSFLKKSITFLCWFLVSQSQLVQSPSVDAAASIHACTHGNPSIQEPSALLRRVNEQIDPTKYISLSHKQLLETLARENLERINALPTIKEVKGDIFLVFHNAFYVTDEYTKFSHRICDEEGNLIPLAQNDVLVSVWATSSPDDTSHAISGNWANHGHPLLGKALIFPEHLPLSLLDGKKEGDLISFFLKNEQDEIVQIEFTCKQLAYRYSFASFEDSLIGIKAGFAQQPFVNSWLVDDAYVAPYMQSGLVEEYIDDAGKVAFRHGPNGFRLNN